MDIVVMILLLILGFAALIFVTLCIGTAVGLLVWWLMERIEEWWKWHVRFPQ